MPRLERDDGVMKTPRTMLTGSQIAAARKLVGMRTRDELAAAADVGLATVARAEAAGPKVPSMNTEMLAKIVRALETAGVVFSHDGNGSIIGGLSMRLRTTPAPDKPPPGGPGVRLRKGGE